MCFNKYLISLKLHDIIVGLEFYSYIKQKPQIHTKYQKKKRREEVK